MKAALPGTQVRHYHGIDLSQAALELAAANLAGLPFEVDLDHRDFVEAMMRRPEHATRRGAACRSITSRATTSLA
jgi:hypothetical protein